MCLFICSDQERNKRDLKKWFGSRTKFAYVYKVLKKDPYESFYRSICHNFIWDFEKQKVFQVDRDPNPTEFELEVRQIREGLHVYTSFKEAKLKRYPYTSDIIVKFKVLKEDVVAIRNNYCFKNRFTQAVCKKLIFVKVVEG
jgi:hypothetical protein